MRSQFKYAAAAAATTQLELTYRAGVEKCVCVFFLAGGHLRPMKIDTNKVCIDAITVNNCKNHCRRVVHYAKDIFVDDARERR